MQRPELSCLLGISLDSRGALLRGLRVLTKAGWSAVLSDYKESVLPPYDKGHYVALSTVAGLRPSDSCSNASLNILWTRISETTGWQVPERIMDKKIARRLNALGRKTPAQLRAEQCGREVCGQAKPVSDAMYGHMPA